MKRPAVLSVCLAACLAAASAAHAVSYTCTKLGSIAGNTYSYSWDINSSGVSVGQSWGSGGTNPYSPIRWTGTTLEKLAMPDGMTFGAAKGVNSFGNAAGSSYAATYTSERATTWDSTGAHVIGDQPGYSWNRAVDINDSGVVVGNGVTTDNISKALLWDGAGLHELGWSASANAINNSGRVVGGSSSLPCYWDNMVIHGLTLLTGTYNGVAYAVNDRGWIAGSCQPFAGYRACIWDDNGVRQLELPTDFWSSQAYGINSKGWVVGNATDANYVSHACLWDDTGFHDLGVPAGATSATAFGINDNGWIVGNADGRAVLWTPVPEPSSVLSLLAGLGGLASLAGRTRRR